jgi:hypothetical protein
VREFITRHTAYNKHDIWGGALCENAGRIRKYWACSVAGRAYF